MFETRRSIPEQSIAATGGHTIMKFSALLIAISLTLPTATFALPREAMDISKPPPLFQAYEARYAVKFHGVSMGEGIHRLSIRPNGNYHFESSTKPHLSFLPYDFLETSDFSWQNGQVKPIRYFYDFHEGKRKKRGFVRFDWPNNTVENTVGKNPWHADLKSGMQDKLSYTFMLRSDLYKGNYQLSYLVAEDDELKPYQFHILGTETISTPLGKLKTIKIEHIHKKGHRTLFWLAKDLDYLLIKIQQERKGKQVGSAEITQYNKL